MPLSHETDGERPHWSILHRLFAGSGPATDADVLEGYGELGVADKARAILSDDIVYRECDTIEKAEAAAWVRLRAVIDEQRGVKAARDERASKYAGDPNNPSPLNPNRPQSDAGRDFPLGVDTRRDEEIHDLITR